MSERGAKGAPEPTAGQILAFHTDHQRGLHVTPLAGCSQCLLDRLADASDEELIHLLEGQAEPA
jgi:hypothetical protein